MEEMKVLSNTQQFINDIIPLSARWYGVVGNYSVLSLCVALWGLGLGKIIGWVLSGAILVIFFFIVGKKKLSIDVAFSISTCIALLVSPLSWLNYLILIFPVLLMTSRQIDWNSRPRRLAFLGLIIIFWNWPSYVELISPSATIVASSMPMGARGLWEGVRKFPVNLLRKGARDRKASCRERV